MYPYGYGVTLAREEDVILGLVETKNGCRLNKLEAAVVLNWYI
jgi:hypothetical protein